LLIGVVLTVTRKELAMCCKVVACTFLNAFLCKTYSFQRDIPLRHAVLVLLIALLTYLCPQNSEIFKTIDEWKNTLPDGKINEQTTDLHMCPLHLVNCLVHVI